MRSETFILIPGRSTEQGPSVGPEYLAGTERIALAMAAG